MIHESRVKPLNKKQITGGSYVLYWMQASQRAGYNHALEYAIGVANEMARPVVVFFGIAGRFPGASERHYRFMLEGLRETGQALERRGIRMVVRRVLPWKGALEMSRRASLVVTDRGYLRIQRAWRRELGKRCGVHLVQIESDVVVPVEVASQKEEYAARTIRPKIAAQLPVYLRPVRHRRPKRDSLGLDFDSLDIADVGTVLRALRINRDVRSPGYLRGGTNRAKAHLRRFLSRKIDRYDDLRNDPTLDYVSHMSPYLHFGQISPLYIALEVKKRRSAGEKAYLEELLVRRELSMNYVFYNDRYDSPGGLPAWCRETLHRHRRNARPYLYGVGELERAETHDPYWNAAQNEMRITGKMHGYMRMYWGKKILEWSADPAGAFRAALYLNDKYEIDGRDPNGYAGVAWCFGKHDRPWSERPVFGTVRYMNDAGLRRKFDADGYVRMVDALGDFSAG